MQNLPYNPADDGFVMSTAQIDRKLNCDDHYEDAKIAKDCDYDAEKYHAHKAGS